jgi:hypothetical protein
MGYKEGKKVFFCLTYKLARLTRVHVELWGFMGSNINEEECQVWGVFLGGPKPFTRRKLIICNHSI